MRPMVRVADCQARTGGLVRWWAYRPSSGRIGLWGEQQRGNEGYVADLGSLQGVSAIHWLLVPAASESAARTRRRRLSATGARVVHLCRGECVFFGAASHQDRTV